jgi:deazaflavin-dependent oxidoreductase (nitroreductase family)
LLLTTTGRRSGQPRTTPLIYGRAGDHYLVVASRGGAPPHPSWYENLVAQPVVQVQVMADRFKARARAVDTSGAFIDYACLNIIGHLRNTRKGETRTHALRGTRIG